jgi:hypothetical protein
MYVQVLTSGADIELLKVKSFEKQQELYNILHSEDPDHYSRLWLAGFLKFCGYSIDEICNIIHDEACWSDYDRQVTWCQVKSVFGIRRSPGKPSNSSSSGAGNSLIPGENKFNPLSKCNSDNPCPDSVNGFCYIAAGEYHIPSVDEKTRRALNCAMDNQIARFQRQERKLKILREIFF